MILIKHLKQNRTNQPTTVTVIREKNSIVADKDKQRKTMPFNTIADLY